MIIFQINTSMPVKSPIQTLNKTIFRFRSTDSIFLTLLMASSSILFAQVAPDWSGIGNISIQFDKLSLCFYGCTIDIHSDQGSNYSSEIFTELCKLINSLTYYS